MKAARYVRVSTEQQARNTSIPTQLERAEAYIAEMGWELAETFVEPGESGANLDRPALNKCRAAACAGRYQTLVIYDLDRFNRDLRDLLNLRHEFQQLGIPVWSICDNLEMTSCDEATFIQVVLRGVFSQVERSKIVRRMRDGIERTVREGKWSGGRTPYGYRRDPESGALTVYEPEAAIVRQIFTWLNDEKLSSYKIAQRLDALGIPTPQAARGQPGKQGIPDGWTSATVRHILHNETYTGGWTFGKKNPDRENIIVDCPLIVERATFDNAQVMLKRNRRNTARPRWRYLLRGLIRCECGAAYCGQKPRWHGKLYPHIYKCLARMDYRKQKRDEPCQAANVPGPELEEAVWADVEQFIRQPHLLVAEWSKQRDTTDDVTDEIARTDQAIVVKQRELERYLRLYGRGSIPIEKVEALVAEAEGHVAALKTYRQQLVEQQHQADLWEQEVASVVKVVAALQDRLAQGIDWDDKRAIVEMLVKGIVIETHTDDDGERYPVAHVTYCFEKPRAEVPIPAELVPLFGDLEALTNSLNSAIIAQSHATELFHARHSRMAPDSLDTGQHHPLDAALLLHRVLDAGAKAGGPDADAHAIPDAHGIACAHARVGDRSTDGDSATHAHPVVPAHAHTHAHFYAHRYPGAHGHPSADGYADADP